MEMISVFYMWNINIKATFLYYEPKNHITLYAPLAQLVEHAQLAEQDSLIMWVRDASRG